MNIRTKLLINTLAPALVVGLAILVFNSILFSGFVDEAMIDRINAASRVAEHHLQDLKTKAAAASLSLSENQDALEALRRNDHAALSAQVAHTREQTEIDFCTITDPAGRVVFRMHAPEKRGDFVAQYATVRAAMAGESLTAVEKGAVVRLSVRAGAPIMDERGAIAGLIFVGYRLDTARFVDEVKRISDCEATVYLDNERVSTTVLKDGGARAIGTTVSAALSNIVLAGHTYAGRIDILGRPAVVRCTPVSGPDGQVVGMLLAGRYIDAATQTLMQFVRNGLLITLALLALTVLAITHIVQRLVTPLQAMTKAASALAVGDLGINVQAQTNDEMRTLAEAFTNMVESTRQQIRIIEQIPNGDMTLSLRPRSPNDLMNRALLKLNETLRMQAEAIREEHERIKLMLDATPLACRLWNRQFELLECNEAAVRLFGVADNREYIDRYYELAPEYQPNGKSTLEKIRLAVGEAFEKGECTHEWMYRLPDGTPLPAENTLVRVPYGDDYVVAVYSRDLREHNKMMTGIKRRDDLLRAVNHIASILLSSADSENFEAALTESMRYLGQCLDIDRIQIWHNETMAESLCVVLNHEWLSDNGKRLAPPARMVLPYASVPGWEEKFLRGESVNGPLRSLSLAEQSLLGTFGIESIIIVPLFLNGRFWGLFSCDDCRQGRHFLEDEVDILRSASLMMAAAVNRNEQAASLRDAHNRNRLLTNATPLGFNLWDRRLRNIETNDTAVKLFGLKSQQEYLERFSDLSPLCQPDGSHSKEKAAALVHEAFETGYLQFEWLHHKADGTPIPAEITLVRLAYEDDYVVAGYIRDLREYKKMLTAIDQRDSLLQTVNHVADTLLRAESGDFSDTLHQCMGMMARAIHADRMYLFKNHDEDGQLRFTQLLEWPEKARLDAGLAAGRAYREQFREMLRRGECVHSLIRNLPADDREYFRTQGILAILLVPVFIHNEFWGLVGFDNCRSEQLFSENEESIMRSGSLLVVNALLRNEYLHSIRETSAKLESALTDAKEANNTKSNFLAHMSHEIRTPLNAVIGLSELTLGDGALAPEAEANLEKIYSAGSTILSIVNDILDISKIESGKFDLNPVRYDTPSFINDTVTLNIVRIQERPVRFKLHVDEHLPSELFGDDLRVKQIFNNLLSNAFKFTDSGSVEWRLSFEREADSVWLVSSVRDTGLGIAPDNLQKLFSNYSQVRSKTNRRADGTGLGLAITKSLAEMMGGSITVESEYGKGSTFHVRLRQGLLSYTPIGKEVANNLMNLNYTLAKRTRYTKLTRVDLSYAHVLVVDDIATNLDVVKGMLKPYAIKVDCAISGRQAVDMIRAENPRYSAVFMDHMMPEMDGVEATQIIRRDIGTDYARDLPIIALTANAIVGNEEMFLNKGFQAFISKPIDVMKLDSVLRAWVRNKDLEQELAAAGADAPLPGGGERGGGNSGGRLDGMIIDGVDINGALERFGGNEAVFIDVLRSYAVNVRPLLRSLPEYLKTENFADYSIVIHGIKGSSYGIAAKRVGREAELLEHAAKAKNVTAVRAGHPAFVIMAERLIAEIEAALGKLGAAESKPGAAEPAPALLREVRDACAAFDMDRVDKAMAQLESFQYERGGKIVAWLHEQIEAMSFEKIFNGEWPSE